jgi:hypothetical protein
MRRIALPSLAAAFVVAALSGCPDRTVAEVHTGGGVTQTKIIPTSADIDILFVIDDSPSTADKQAVFVSNFTRLVAALGAFPTGRPNVHIGVVSTSVDIGSNDFGTGCASPNTTTDGRLQATARVTGCSPPTGAPYLEDIAVPGGGRQTNYSGTLDQALSCIAELGTGGCGFESPLAAMEKALDGSRPENAGFLRPGAYLAVIILTDEDDASVDDPAIFGLDASAVGPGDFRAQPMYAYDCDRPIDGTAPGSYHGCTVRTGSYLADPAGFADFLSGLKSPGQVVVGVIGGDPTPDLETGAITTPFNQPLALLPSCTATINGNYAIGRPGLRLADFADRFGDHGLYDTVCQPDYSQTLTDIGDLLFASVSPCLEGDVAYDPATPSKQPECVVTDITDLNTPDQAGTVIPVCPMLDATTPDPAAPRPCWWVAEDAATCPDGSHLDLHVERDQPPPTGDNVQVSCVTR